ncbi:MAG TPA: VWA domain-containing protein [Desulfurivibrio alkaliphilus]|uniref:VWA domain-containing protein n=1 Tax=Desulfurivibrio alkaliphilus TaxID=427923 RepID=A0A7C2TKP2_9BACT|nr:VWA domain-containing protein [Desulfurivibrio alkaliphilus]
MDHSELTARLAALIEVDALNYWEIEDYVEQLAAQPTEVQEEVLRQVGVIWPVSQALCLDFLDQVQRGLNCLHHSRLGEWVNATLDVYEKDGLKQAQRFLAEVESNFLCQIRGKSGLGLTEAGGRLLPYLRGLAGRALDLASAPTTYTDSQTIFLPPEITLCKEKRENFLTYKLLASWQWGLLAAGTFSARLTPEQPLIRELIVRHGRRLSSEQPFPANFYHLFPDPELAGDLFLLVETVRITKLMRQELPGLMRDSAPILAQLRRQRPALSGLEGKNRLLEALNHWALTAAPPESAAGPNAKLYARAVELLLPLANTGGTIDDSLGITAQLYRLCERLPGGYHPEHPPILGGRLQPRAVEAIRLRRREESRQQFIKALGAMLAVEAGENAPPERHPAQRQKPSGLPDDAAAALLPPPAKGGEGEQPLKPPPAETEYITVGGREIKIPEPLRELAGEIRQDLGRIPERYISAALEQAGTAAVGGPGPDPNEGPEATGPLLYDEWDYRRGGFRKNWCTLLEKQLLPVSSPFVENTREKYRGQLRLLKRQFEMMRLQQRFVRRQKEGDEIDLDAAIEALIDIRAGHPASDNLFIRLNRDERNIAAIFLVDMSYSTEGWVSTALKEALVLMCESLQVLGDRYAIYGFSGMRRSRAELYQIKHLGEQYDRKVKGRISAIIPKDYTRMGPPIRHVSRILAASEAKIRLLITLSDGKPEDYDDYKGEYAIEDTRHALIEAKAAGIHPFCITIDREAQEYIPHMYGAVNYIFINDVKRLPLRMPEIYRALTT